ARRVGARGGRARRVRALPVRGAAEDEGGSRVRAAHDRDDQQDGDGRGGDAARRLVSWGGGGGDSKGDLAGGLGRGGGGAAAEPVLWDGDPAAILVLNRAKR